MKRTKFQGKPRKGRITKLEKSHVKHLYEYVIWHKKMLKEELNIKPRRLDNMKRITRLRSIIGRTQQDIRIFKEILRRRG